MLLLDTNIVSHAIRNHPSVRRTLSQSRGDRLCVSALTEAELRYGLHRHGQPPTLTRAVDRFLSELEVLPWRSEEARTFASLRAELESLGRVLAPMDLLIAAQAITLGAVLVSDDRVFGQVPHLRLENWLAA